MAKSVRNILFGIGGQLITILFNFASRTVFLYCFTKEYVGVSSLFTGILSVLSLTDLGMETSMTVRLYKPLSQNNREEIGAYLDFYRKVYYVIAAIILALGIGLLPFLDVLIDIPKGIQDIELIYILTLLNTVVSYLFVYQKILLVADQKKYRTDIVLYVRTVVQFCVMIPALLIYRSYVLYLAIQILFTLLYNLAIMAQGKKEYPFLCSLPRAALPANERAEIRNDTKALTLHRIGDVVSANAVTLLTAVCVNVVAVAVYSNYQLILSYIKTMMDKIYYSISPSIGNLTAEGDREKIKTVFDRMFFVSFWMTGFCATSLICLLNPFLQIWLGASYLFQMDVVALIVVNFILVNLRKPALIFKEAYGLFTIDRFRPLVESGILIALSLILSKWFALGLAGILIGMSAAFLLTTFWMEPMILYRHGFCARCWRYFAQYLLDAAVICAGILVTNGVCRFFSEDVFGFLLRFAAVVVIPNFLYAAVFHRNASFVWASATVRSAVKKKTAALRKHI